MRALRTQRSKRRRGSTVVEAALMLGFFVTPTLLGVFEYGRLVMMRQLMTNAAREGARMAVVGTASNPAVTTAQIQALVQSYLVGQPLSNLQVSVYQADPATGKSIGAWDQTPYGGALVVQLSGNYTPAVIGLFPAGTQTIPLKTVSMMLSEAN